MATSRASITIETNIMSHVGLQLTYLQMILTYSKDQLGHKNDVSPNIVCLLVNKFDRVLYFETVLNHLKLFYFCLQSMERYTVPKKVPIRVDSINFLGVLLLRNAVFCVSYVVA